MTSFSRAGRARQSRSRRPAPGSPDERTALSYARLRLVNDAVEDPEALASDPRMLASLHEWTGFTDGALGTLAGIHYNLFLGSFVDHDGHRHDLSPYVSMNRTGTFLCTELDHGNSVRHMVQAQTLNPAGSDDAPVDETDSSRTRNSLKVYRIDVSTPRYGIVDTEGGGTGTTGGSNSQPR